MSRWLSSSSLRMVILNSGTLLSFIAIWLICLQCETLIEEHEETLIEAFQETVDSIEDYLCVTVVG